VTPASSGSDSGTSEIKPSAAQIPTAASQAFGRAYARADGTSDVPSSEPDLTGDALLEIVDADMRCES
jgi:hypothetical protein